MTDSAEKLLREAMNELSIVGSYAGEPDLTIGMRIRAKAQQALADRIRAHPSAHPVTGEGDANGGWLPIASAPRDRRILVWNGYFGVYSSQYTEERDAAGEIAWSGYPLGLTDIGFGKWYAVASYWRELPAAPMTAASGMDEGE